MSASQDAIRRLLGAGQSKASVARTLGVNSSLIGQVEKGAKPGNNLLASLQALEARAAQLPRGTQVAPSDVPAPPRRQARGGGAAGVRQARVRQPDTRGGPRSGVSAVKRQAVQSGAKRLEGVLENARVTGRHVAITVTLSPKVNVKGSGGRDATLHKRRGSTPASKEVRIGDSAGGGSPTWWLDRIDSAGGDVTEAVRAALVELGMAESVTRDQVWGLELSTWS